MGGLRPTWRSGGGRHSAGAIAPLAAPAASSSRTTSSPPDFGGGAFRPYGISASTVDPKGFFALPRMRKRTFARRGRAQARSGSRSAAQLGRARGARMTRHRANAMFGSGSACFGAGARCAEASPGGMRLLACRPACTWSRDRMGRGHQRSDDEMAPALDVRRLEQGDAIIDAIRHHTSAAAKQWPAPNDCDGVTLARVAPQSPDARGTHKHDTRCRPHDVD